MLTADEGKILTNGETYGRVVALGSGDTPDIPDLLCIQVKGQKEPAGCTFGP